MQFIDNKYTKIYYSIINIALLRVLPDGVYSEKHHIIPKSIGGVDSNDNIVKLTAREHFICHWLLIKMTTGNHTYSMVYALSMMRCASRYHNRYSTAITSRVYEKLKEKRVVSDETREKMKISNRKGYGRIQSADEKAKRAASHRGKVVSEETKRKISASQIGKHISEETRHKLSIINLGKKQSEETKKKRAISHTGKRHSDETKQRMRDAWEIRKAKKLNKDTWHN